MGTGREDGYGSEREALQNFLPALRLGHSHHSQLSSPSSPLCMASKKSATAAMKASPRPVSLPSFATHGLLGEVLYRVRPASVIGGVERLRPLRLRGVPGRTISGCSGGASSPAPRRAMRFTYASLWADCGKHVTVPSCCGISIIPSRASRSNLRTQPLSLIGFPLDELVEVVQSEAAPRIALCLLERGLLFGA